MCHTFIIVLIFALERTSREHIGNNNHHYGNIKKYYRLFDVNITFFFPPSRYFFIRTTHSVEKGKKKTFSSLTTTIYYRAPRHNSCIYTIDTLCFFCRCFSVVLFLIYFVTFWINTIYISIYSRSVLTNHNNAKSLRQLVLDYRLWMNRTMFY